MHHARSHGCALIALAALCLAGCDDSTSPTDAGVRIDAAPSLDAGPALDAGASPDAGEPPPGETGSIGGVVTRSAEPAAGGVGNLYIALFDRDPIMARDSAVMVANSLVEDADMRSASVEIPYEVVGIPPRADAYFVVAFLDDNDTVNPSDPDTAGPDRGDLVSLEGFSSPRVVVNAAHRVSFDIDLNFNLPF